MYSQMDDQVNIHEQCNDIIEIDTFKDNNVTCLLYK